MNDISNIDESQIVATDRAGVDDSVYEGQRYKIGSVKLKEVKDYYPNGEYDKTSSDMKTVVEIKTTPLYRTTVDEEGDAVRSDELVEFTQEDGSVKHKYATQIFNLVKEVVDGKINYQISKHPKANFWNFLLKMKATADTLPEIRQKLIDGDKVTLTTTPSKKQGEEDRRYVSIVTK